MPKLVHLAKNHGEKVRIQELSPFQKPEPTRKPMRSPICLLLLVTVGLVACSKSMQKVPLSSEKTGLDAGFRMNLQQGAERPAVVARCIDDFQATEGKRLQLKKILVSGKLKFLIFGVVYVEDAPAVVYAVDDGKLVFKFYYLQPGTGA